jgi:hypothetical protein
MMLQEEVSLNIYGKPRLKQAGLHTITVMYNKTITMKGTYCLLRGLILVWLGTGKGQRKLTRRHCSLGLNKLAGFQVLDMKLDPDRDDGMNAEGSVLIPNPSVTMIAMVRPLFSIAPMPADRLIHLYPLGQRHLRPLLKRHKTRDFRPPRPRHTPRKQHSPHACKHRPAYAAWSTP